MFYDAQDNLMEDTVPHNSGIFCDKVATRRKKVQVAKAVAFQRNESPREKVFTCYEMGQLFCQKKISSLHLTLTRSLKLAL